MFKDRYERGRITFPSTCTRCGRAEPQRTTQLVLPYRAWWRSNPIIKAPVCTRCFISLGVQAWASLTLMLGASAACTFYLSQWGMLFLISAQRSIFRSVSTWVYSRPFVEFFVICIVFLAMFFFGHFRDQFLRRDHLKVKITDYRDDWIELSSSDGQYFSELAKSSEPYSD